MRESAITPSEITVLFGSIDHRAADVVAFVDALPRTCRGALAHCDLGTSSRGDHCVCLVAFRASLPEATIRRLDFWAWRLGGSVSQGSHDAAVWACDQVFRQVPAWELSWAVRDLLGRHLGSGPATARSHLVLRLQLDGPESAGVLYERSRRALFVPSPRRPPLGEPMGIELRARGGETLEMEAVVTELRDAGHCEPGTPAGFLLGLVSPGEPLLRALQDQVPAHPSPSQRRAPRYPVRALARLKECDDGGPDGIVLDDRPGDAVSCVENLSQGGAFVRTSARAPKGTRLRIEMDLPGGRTAEVTGEVVYSNERGFGTSFEADPHGQEVITSALEHIAVHRRRALIVDDDSLCRRMMSDTLEAAGFDVFVADNGADGLRSVIDLLLHLDLAITDVHMPGMDGERLVRVIRDAGGERDLTLVAMTGELDAAVHERLMAAGADAVLRKAEGMARVAETAVRIMLRRERSRRALLRPGAMRPEGPPEGDGGREDRP